MIFKYSQDPLGLSDSFSSGISGEQVRYLTLYIGELESIFFAIWLAFFAWFSSNSSQNWTSISLSSLRLAENKQQ